MSVLDSVLGGFLPLHLDQSAEEYIKLVEKLRTMNELTKLTREKERVKHNRIVEDLDKRNAEARHQYELDVQRETKKFQHAKTTTQQDYDAHLRNTPCAYVVPGDGAHGVDVAGGDHSFFDAEHDAAHDKVAEVRQQAFLRKGQLLQDKIKQEHERHNTEIKALEDSLRESLSLSAEARRKADASFDKKLKELHDELHSEMDQVVKRCLPLIPRLPAQAEPPAHGAESGAAVPVPLGPGGSGGDADHHETS